MASKFYNQPQLRQAQLSNAQQTNLPSEDVKAKTEAQRASRDIDALVNLSQGVVSSINGVYQENILAKNRLSSRKQRPAFLDHVNSKIASTENFESLGSKGLQQKYKEYSEEFLKMHEGKPYERQLKTDLETMSVSMLDSMFKKRDAMHSKIVSDATAEGASSVAQMHAQGLIDADQLKGRIAQLSYDSTIAFQVPSSSELELNEDNRGKYQGLTREQANESILRGIMIQTGEPANSKVADILNDKDFRKSLGISSTDEDYNKLVNLAYKKGKAADKVNYEKGMDSIKESLYTQINQGFVVNFDKELKQFKANGGLMSAEDEFDLRKTINKQNTVVQTSDSYRENLFTGKDITAGMPKKDRESIYERSFTDILGLNSNGISVDNVSAALSDKKGQVGFSDYIKTGGKLPEKFIKMFDVPAGASVDKWNRANAAITTMQAAAVGSGQSIESLIGVNQTSKIRGMARLLNDDQMEASVKQNAIEALQTQSTSFNSKGYLKGTSATPIDTDWLTNVSRDASWTTDDYTSDMQNADEIAGNYQAYRMAGNSEEDAKELAMDLFKKSNRSFEMSNGGEIVIPIKHKNLNNISLDEFSKSLDAQGKPRFPSLKQQRDDLELTTGKGWLSDWRARRNVSFQKSYNFGKTGNYDMLYDGKLVDNATFSYAELDDFISNSPSKLKEKMIGGKHRTLNEVEEEAFENRSKNIKSRKESLDQNIENLFDLTI